MRNNRISQTAVFIAIKFYGLTRIPSYRSLFDEETIQFYERIVASAPAPLRWYHYWLKKKWVRRFFIRMEELLLPGDLMHILMRKYYIGRELNRLLVNHKKAEQLIVLGGGFDHSGTCYSSKGISVLEIDVPPMVSLKKDFLNAYNLANRHLRISEATFGRQSLTSLLTTHPSLDPGRPVAVLAEGFFDYLSPETSQEVLEELSSYFQAPCYLVSTMFDLTQLSAFRQKVFTGSIALAGERIRLHLTLEEFQQLLQEQNFSVLDRFDEARIKKEMHPLLNNRSLLKGFSILTAVSQ